jgi:hypothetical protein
MLFKDLRCQWSMSFLCLPRGIARYAPDRDIELVIELKPVTASIYKTPFRITTIELAELKEHIKELLEKGFIHPSSSP